MLGAFRSFGLRKTADRSPDAVTRGQGMTVRTRCSTLSPEAPLMRNRLMSTSHEPFYSEDACRRIAIGSTTWRRPRAASR